MLAQVNCKAKTELIMTSSNNILKVALLIFVVSLSFYSSMYGDSRFFSRGEAREALVTSAMIESGNLILPLTKADEISCKPPALHWLGVITSKVSGYFSEWMVRFPSVFLGSISLVLLFLIFRHLANYQTAILGVLILGTSIEWLRSASHARVDMCLAFGLTFSLVALYKIIHLWKEGIGNYWPWLLLCIFASTFAVLSKGPMGLVIPIAVTGVYFIIVCEAPKFKKTLSFLAFPCLPMLLISLGLSSIWYILAYQQQGDLFVTVHLINENLARFIDVSDFLPGHRKPFYYSFIYLFTSFLPWSLFLPLLGAWLWKNRSKLKDMQSNGVLFSVVWLVLIFIMGTVSSSKRSVYFLPAFPPLAYLLAFSIDKCSLSLKDFPKSHKFLTRSVAITTGVFTLAVVFICALVFSEEVSTFLLTFVKKQKDVAQVELYRSILSSAAEFYFIIALAIISFFISFRLLRSNQVVKSTFSLSLAVILVAASVTLGVKPSAIEAMSTRSFTEEIEAKLPEGAKVYQYRYTYYAFVYYGMRDMPQIKNIRDVDSKSFHLIAAKKDLDRISKEASNFDTIVESNFFARNGNGKLYLLKITV